MNYGAIANKIDVRDSRPAPVGGAEVTEVSYIHIQYMKMALNCFEM